MLNQKLMGKTGTDKTYIEDVFSTYLYTGNSTARIIDNGIKLNVETQYTASGSYSYTVPQNVSTITVAIIGCGGNAGTASTAPGDGSGGGGGALAYWVNMPVTPGETLTVTVGTPAVSFQSGTVGDCYISRGSTVLIRAGGGGGGQGETGAGGSGGVPYFDSSAPIANIGGGNGGIGCSAYDGSAAGGGGSGGWGDLGDTNYANAAGGNGANFFSNPGTGLKGAGDGGDSYPSAIGGGGANILGRNYSKTTGIARAGAIYGGGGTSEDNNTGGSGGSGIVRILTVNTSYPLDGNVSNTEAGLVWIKQRTGTASNYLQDTIRGITYTLSSDLSAAQAGPFTGTVTATNSNGFSLGTSALLNGSGTNYASWTFRKAPKFFDVVTFTTNSNGGATVNHSLGITPGFVVIKGIGIVGDWWSYHIAGPALGQRLNSTNATGGGAISSVSATNFTVSGVEASTQFIAYVFAHDTTTDGLIQCGAFTTNASAIAEVNLGWEPQLVLIKSTSVAGNWFMLDNMRAFSYNNSTSLAPNLSTAESSLGPQVLTPTGFKTNSGGGIGVNTSYIYMAIRRGPMKIPTDATKVFSTQIWTGNAVAQRNFTTSNIVDALLIKVRTGANAYSASMYDRIRGIMNSISTASTAVETSVTTGVNGLSKNINKDFNTGANVLVNASGYTYVGHIFSRAPGFFDVVCWEGDGTYGRNIPHNLKVVPELVIVKNRKLADNWYVNGPYTNWSLGYPCMFLNLNSAAVGNTNTGIKNVTSTTFEVNHPSTNSNSATRDYVAYLFASCPGVSNVGSYTGNGSSQTINCGFTNGARFVMIKRTDTTGDWYVFDTARGIVAGDDPFLYLNSTAAETTTNDFIDPISSGFQLSPFAPAGMNASGGTYIYLAIA